MALARKVTMVAAATLGSRVLAFLRDAGIAALLGAGPVADAVFAAFQLPNLARRLLAEGALNAAFVPVWLRIRADEGAPAARRFAGGVFGLVAITLGIVTLALVAFAPWVVGGIAPGFAPGEERAVLAVDLVRMTAPYVLIAGCVAVLAAILAAEGRIGAVAFGPIVFNLVLLAAVAALLIVGEVPAVATAACLAAAMVVAGLAQAGLIGGAVARAAGGMARPTPVWSPEIRRLFLRAGPGLLASGVPQLTILAGSVIASSTPSAVSWLAYADRLYELPLGVVSVMVATVIGPTIAAGVRHGSASEIATAQSRALEVVLGLALPAAVGLGLLAEPIVRALFERGAFGEQDTVVVAGALAVLAAGLPGHVLEKVLGAVSFAHEDTRTPMMTACAGLAVAALAASLLVAPYGTLGIAAGIALGGYVSAGLLAVVLFRRGRISVAVDSRKRLAKLALATGVMAGALVIERAIAPGAPVSTAGRVALLLALVSGGLLAYAGALRLLGVGTLADLRSALRRRDAEG